MDPKEALCGKPSTWTCKHQTSRGLSQALSLIAELEQQRLQFEDTVEDWRSQVKALREEGEPWNELSFRRGAF